MLRPLKQIENMLWPDVQVCIMACTHVGHAWFRTPRPAVCNVSIISCLQRVIKQISKPVRYVGVAVRWLRDLSSGSAWRLPKAHSGVAICSCRSCPLVSASTWCDNF